MKNILRFLFVMFCLFTSANPSHAQWVQTNLGGTATCFAAINEETLSLRGITFTTYLFAGTDGSGVYLSSDNGTTWTAVDSGLTNPSICTLAATTSGLGFAATYYLFAGTNDGLLLSTNTGTSWTSVFSSTTINALAFSGTNFFAGSGGAGIYYSTNSGTNWYYSGKPSNLNVNALLISDTNFFAGTNGGVFLSTNNGTNWTALNNVGLTNNHVQCLAVSGTNLFAGTNGGVFLLTGFDWTAINTGMQGNTTVDALVFSGTNLFAGTDGGVYLSTNDGTSWAAVDSGLPTLNFKVNAVVISGGYLFAGTNGGVWRRPLSEMITAVHEAAGTGLPNRFSLEQNYPNPFNPTTTIKFDLKENSTVKLDVFNVLGQRVQEFDLGRMSTGSYSQSVDMSRYASGVYLYRIDAMASDGERFVSTKKMVLIK